MKNNRHVIDNDDRKILDYTKQVLTKSINTLKQRNLREANIEIELMTHIKKILKGE